MSFMGQPAGYIDYCLGTESGTIHVEYKNVLTRYRAYAIKCIRIHLFGSRLDKNVDIECGHQLSFCIFEVIEDGNL